MAGILDTSLSPPASGTAESIANEAHGTHSFKIEATFNGTAQPLHIRVTLKRAHSPESPNVSSSIITSPDTDIKSDLVLMVSIQLNSVALQLEHQLKEDRPVSIVPSDILEGKPSIAALNNLVGAKIEDKYHLFGVAIGLNEGYLRGLDKDYTTCQERFNQIFYEWSQVDPENFTWKKVIQVLRSDTIRANEVADLVIKHLIGTQ